MPSKACAVGSGAPAPARQRSGRRAPRAGRSPEGALAGRFEIVHLPHWTWAEMQEAFDWNVEQYLFYGVTPEPRRSTVIEICSTPSQIVRAISKRARAGEE